MITIALSHFTVIVCFQLFFFHCTVPLSARKTKIKCIIIIIIKIIKRLPASSCLLLFPVKSESTGTFTVLHSETRQYVPDLPLLLCVANQALRTHEKKDHLSLEPAVKPEVTQSSKLLDPVYGALSHRHCDPQTPLNSL